MFAFAAFAITNLFVDDYIEAKANGGKTIAQRVVHFFRDYKSEVKKIVWPNYKEVLKNTGIVLVMCAVVGALIWLVDWGLGSLIELILNSVK
ncbi:MAG: preprotein translocase subunit SecE [Clostridia bacterium]|nr:preprotein translocase subunit SecE [Clostridia bacterium]